jgi:hypothetical protein
MGLMYRKLGLPRIGGRELRDGFVAGTEGGASGVKGVELS